MVLSKEKAYDLVIELLGVGFWSVAKRTMIKKCIEEIYKRGVLLCQLQQGAIDEGYEKMRVEDFVFLVNRDLFEFGMHVQFRMDWDKFLNHPKHGKELREGLEKLSKDLALVRSSKTVMSTPDDPDGEMTRIAQGVPEPVEPVEPAKPAKPRTPNRAVYKMDGYHVVICYKEGADVTGVAVWNDAFEPVSGTKIEVEGQSIGLMNGRGRIPMVPPGRHPTRFWPAIVVDGTMVKADLAAEELQ